MTPVRHAFLDAADAATALLADPAVAAAWTRPSALEGFTVGGLAAHLAQQVLNAERAVRHELPDVPRVALLEHYARSAWVGAPLDAEANVDIVAGAEALATQGPEALLADTGAAVARLRAALPGEPADRFALMPWWHWCLRLDDLLITRMMEIAVHSDDLAVSAGIPTPPLPPEVLEPVLDLLARLALRRHGPTALLRAYSRAERATAVSAF